MPVPGGEIANAYVAIYAKMPGVRGDIQKALGGPDVQSTLKSSGKSMGAVITGAVGGAVASVTGKAISTVLGSIDGAIKRVDTMNNFPKIMQNLGYSSDDAKKSIETLSDRLTGLPTSLDSMAGAVQKVAPLTGNLAEATDISLALNDALLAGGKSTDLQANAMEQYTQMLSIGKVDMAAWRSMMSAMPGQLGQLSESLLGAGANSMDLYAAMQDGTVSFDDFNKGLLALDKQGVNGYASFADQAKDATDGIGTGTQNMYTAITRGLANLIGKFQPELSAFLEGTTDVINGIFTGVGGAVDWIKGNLDWIGPLAAGIGAGAAAWALWTGAIKTWTTITNLAKAAQIAFNVVMNANPIGLIVTAIAAVVGALVWFFTQTEVGKKAWGEFTSFLSDAWQAIADGAKWLWENVLQPVFQAIGDIVSWVWNVIIKPVVDLVVNYFRFWGAVAKWLWENAVKPALKAIGDFLQAVWRSYIKPVIDFIADALKMLGAGFKWLYENIVRPVWTAIKDAMSVTWKWIDQHIFTPFKKGIDLLAKGFETAKAAIKKTWDGIKQVAAKPINFVLDTVWNKGLRSFWNDLVTTLNLKDMKLPAAKLVKFASGGVLPGYTPGRDVHQFYSPTGGRLALSGGEAIMRPEFTRMVGGKAGVDRLNAMARSGQAFKDGGVWDAIGNFAGDVWDNIVSAAKVAGQFITDPAGAVQKHIIDGIIKPLIGGDGNIFLRTVAQMPINLVKKLASSFEGLTPQTSKGMGWQAMWDIVQANVPGVVKTSDYRNPGLNAAVGGVKGSYHTQGRAIDLVPATMATFNAVKALFPDASELIYTPAGSQQLQNGRPFAGWSDAVRRAHYNHVHLAMAGGGVMPRLYDQGGWLPHGGIAVNRSGKPEAVLTSAQSQALLNGGLRAGDRLSLVVDGREFSAYVKEKATDVVAGGMSSRMAQTARRGTRL